jgi:ribosomal protein S18 acetylase RimI-like enzyme
MSFETLTLSDFHGASLSLRPAQAADEAFLRQVYASTRAFELQQVPWTLEQKAAFCDMQFTAQDSYYRATFVTAQFLVIEQNAVPAGRLYVERQDDEIHIIDIALMPEHRGRGIGTYLLQKVMQEGQSIGKKVTIYVERYNPALSLYQRLGYELVKEHGVHYLMEWMPR